MEAVEGVVEAWDNSLTFLRLMAIAIIVVTVSVLLLSAAGIRSGPPRQLPPRPGARPGSTRSSPSGTNEVTDAPTTGGPPPSKSEA